MTSLPSLAEIQEAMRSGALSAATLLEFCLARIDQREDEIHAWVHIDTNAARARALELDARTTQGVPLGPLHGVPIGIKDIIDVQGLPTRAGSSLRDHHQAERDAPVVARLRDAGAIILGKTVTCEFACFDPSPTRNPRNPKHTPGGSSSGSAAAVAAQMCPASIGSQTGGSIIRPAAYCGVAGLKPTFGAIPTDGVFPVSSHLDHVGPFARSAEDLRILFCAITETQPPPANPKWDLALLTEFFMDQADESVRRSTTLSWEQLAAHTRNTGIALRNLELQLPGSFTDVHRMHRVIMAVDAAAVHRRDYRSHPKAYGSHVARLIEEGLATSPGNYHAALEHQRTFQLEIDRWFPPDTILVTPSTNTTAPARLDTTGDPKFNSPWSYAGLPAVTIPGCLADNGMPCGLQFIGPRNADHQLLQTACQIGQFPAPTASQSDQTGEA